MAERNTAIRIVLADDQAMIRSGIKLILEQDSKIAVAGEAATSEQAYTMVAKHRPDILLLNLSMPPGQNGLVECANITQEFPETKIIILTTFTDPEFLRYTLSHGAKGYITKSASAEELLVAVHAVNEGHIYIEARIAQNLASIAADGTYVSELSKLTPRELEILVLLAKGYTNREISEHAFLSVKTVEAHRSRIYKKLDIKTRAQLVRFTLEHRLLNL